MRASVKVNGDSELDRKLASLAASIGRSLPSLVSQGARSLAQNYAFHASPYGFDESSAETFRRSIEAEVRRVYVTRENARGVYLLIRQVDPAAADAYWAAHKKGSLRRAADILNRVSVPKGRNIAFLKNARTGRNAHVPKKILPRSLVTTSELRSIIKDQQRLVGLAKAGCYQAGRKLGRMRTNTTDQFGNRSTSETVPSYIRKVANRFSGLGAAKTSATSLRAEAEIFITVRYISNALTKSRQLQAEEKAKDFFFAACREALSYYRAKHFRRSA